MNNPSSDDYIALALEARTRRMRPSEIRGIVNPVEATDLDLACVTALRFHDAALWGKKAGSTQVRGRVKAGNAFPESES